jgi:HPt (histidine-containing phosphotransfer) domain-containing protein
MDAHIGKPFDLDALVQLLRRLTGRDEASAASVERAAPAPLAVTPSVRAAADEAGIDLASALVRMGGRSAVYERLLRNFCQDLKPMPEQLAAHLADGASVEARRLMHSLKGLAATLGAKGLAAEAEHAEAHFAASAAADPATGEAVVRRMAATVDAALPAITRLHEALAAAAQATAAPPQAAPTDVAVLVRALRRLAHALDESDMHATALIQELQERHATALGDGLQPLDEAIARLDFGTALRHCNRLIEEQTP